MEEAKEREREKNGLSEGGFWVGRSSVSHIILYSIHMRKEQPRFIPKTRDTRPVAHCPQNHYSRKSLELIYEKKYVKICPQTMFVATN